MINIVSLISKTVGILSTILIVLQILNQVLSLPTPIHVHFLSKKYFSWNQVYTFIKQLANKIKEENIGYGMIVATGRGGGILAGLLSYKLNLVPVLILDRKYTEDNQGNKQIVCIESEIKIDENFKDIKEKPILLLTSKSDPGVTLDKYIQVLKKSGFTNSIDKCAILASEKTIDTLKYCLIQYSSNRNVKGFPWEKDNPDLMKTIIKLTAKNN